MLRPPSGPRGCVGIIVVVAFVVVAGPKFGSGALAAVFSPANIALMQC